MTATISALTVSGFRSCGATPQTLLCSTALTVVSGTNSQGKTSLAEAFEFLLTGRIVRRELTASAQEEFADALRNAHLDDGLPVYIIAEVVDASGATRRGWIARGSPCTFQSDQERRLCGAGPIAASAHPGRAPG